MTSALPAVLDEARALAPSRDTPPEAVRELLLRILAAASDDPTVAHELEGVTAGRALLRFTDAPLAIEFRAGAGRLHAEPAETRGKGPKVDATSATWLGLLGGTLKPWLAFTRGLVVCRAGLTELRWLQQVAERLQTGYRGTAAEVERLRAVAEMGAAQGGRFVPSAEVERIVEQERDDTLPSSGPQR